MARPRSLDPKCVVVTVKFTRGQAAHLDRMRGPVSRGEWLRYLVMRDSRAARDDVK